MELTNGVAKALLNSYLPLPKMGRKEGMMNNTDNMTKMFLWRWVLLIALALMVSDRLAVPAWSQTQGNNRGQNNNAGNVSMLDPYGFARDDRMDERGNRGRPIREASEETLDVPEEVIPEEEVVGEVVEEKEAATCSLDAYGEGVEGTYIDGTYIFITYHTYYAAYYASIGYDSAYYNYESLGYSREEIAYLETLSVAEIYDAYHTGYVVANETEQPLISLAENELDLSNVINYAESYEYIYYPGDTVEYEVSLTNPYDTELTISMTVTIEYMNNSWVYNEEVGTYQRQHLVGQAVQGDSTETWDAITLAPGETINVYDSYDMPKSAYWANYQIDVTITEICSGLSYQDPQAGWFDPPLNLSEAHSQSGR